MTGAPVTSPSTALFRSELLTVGRLDMLPDHPLFADGPVAGDMVVFPEFPLWLARSRDVTRVVDATVAVTYFDGQEFRRIAHTPNGAHGTWIAPRALLARELGELLGRERPEKGDERFPATAIPIPGRIHGHVGLLHRAATVAHADPLSVDELALGLLHAVFRHAITGRPEVTRAHRDLAERARFELARELSSALTLGQLASSLRTSPSHLCRVFRMVTGTTLRAYRRELRLRRALLMLGDTRDDLTVVAYALGFASHSHFTEWFRRAYGCTPSGYRRLLHERHSTRRDAARIVAPSRGDRYGSGRTT